MLTDFEIRDWCWQNSRNQHYPDVRLAVAILLGATERRVQVRRTLLQRFRDAYREFMRTETVIPPKAP